MDKIKAFFKTAYKAVAANFVYTVKNYPYTAASLALLGVGIERFLLWVL